MGAKDSKPCCISYEEAVKRVTDAELRRLKDAFKRSANLNCVITKPGFIKDVLGEFVPLKLAEYIFQACGGTSKGISFKDLLCGLVLLTRGEEPEKIKFIFCLCCNEAGTHVYKDNLVRLVQACDNGYVPEAIADCFSDSERVTFEEFKDWLLHRRDATSLTNWLLVEKDTVTLSNELETPTFYQTLAGVTHLQESDIIDLEKRYWLLKTQSRSGRLDLETLRPLICPPVPLVLCEGIFNAFDENQDGHIDFKEMACGISACCRGPLTERQKFCFKIFDQDRDGILSEEEVKNMVQVLLFVKNENRILCRNEAIMSFSASENHDLNDVVKEIIANHDPNLVCHVIFGLRPYTKEDEGDIIRSWIEREERRGMQVGSLWYLIASDWWISWNEYVDYQGPLASGCCTPTYPSGSLKRNSKMQRRVDGSVAQTDDGSSNVILSSVTSVGDESSTSLSESISSILSSFNSDSSSNALSPDSLGNGGTSLVRTKSNTLQPPDLLRTPNHSPNVNRRNMSYVPQRPTSIDNTSLIVPNTLKVIFLTGEGGRLRKNPTLLRGRDFELVPEAVWRALSQWYGGSPQLPRQVILPRNGMPELELYLLTLKLYRHQPNTGRPVANPWAGAVGNVASSYGGNPSLYMTNLPTVHKRYLAYLASFSHLATLRQVFEFICMRLRLRLEETRLWLYKDDSNLTLLEDENSSLQQLGIEDNEQILIEVRNKDQTWPEEMTNVMNAKWDQKSQGPTEKGATGLNNLGNTCFMNAALQCVSNTQPLTLYFNSNRHLYELNRINQHGMKGHIAKRYGDLVQDLWSGTSRTIAPLKLRLTIGKYAPRFNGFQQHDSQELLAFLIDGLHEDLNRVHEKPYSGLKDSDGRPDEEVAFEAWENHVRREQSIIVDLFHGQLQSTVTCKVCGHTSVRFDPFNYLSLPLPMESCIHLEIVVIRLDGSKPVKYGLQLNHDDKYTALKQQLGKLCNLNPQQLLVTEVSEATFKSIPLDDNRIRIVGGSSFYAYELYFQQDYVMEEEARPTRETHTLTQIQRMPLSDSSSKVFPSPILKKAPAVTLNGDAYKISNERECGDGPGKSIFSVGDSDSDSTNSQMNSPPVQQSQGPWILGGAPNYTSNMSSSMVSNSSTGEFNSDFYQKNFVVGYHRKMIRQDVYFLSSQKCRPTLFGLPLILPCHEMTTNQDLYQAVWTQVARLVSPLPPSETAVSNHAQDCDDSLGYEYPFTLKAVQRNGYLCAHCPWYRFCRGCKIECCDADFNFGCAVIAIDWDPTALHLRYQTSLERDFIEHESVDATKRLQTEPINLDDCLEAFTKEEQLGEAEKYYCSKCKEHQLASKKLNIWRLPPILIVHLKRFQLLHGRWVKSHKIVQFPFEDFDPTDYLAQVPRETIIKARGPSNNVQIINHLDHNDNCAGQSSNQNVPSQKKLISDSLFTNESIEICNGEIATESSFISDLPDYHQHRLADADPFSMKYRLYALACHSGILGGGHYVCYAYNPNNKWYCYNDSSCKEVQRDQIDTDSAYMLFYEREGIDYEQYMPDVKGKVPDTSDIDAEFETDFRKMCSLS
ncbi:ubiquitin carboxyl-terminal hydrolase 32 isoform X2 [Parasteatoda tepidariorum]|uniref:ubiquitin carboxyl-terminal hydrolase 32 isoform X2 n=1 Tax=Parasteatoda tepidariorum TaxID=114398 RepID=UPI001C7206D6|nr:ubiquitin carboxyl-terminal hydrolase 32 isoform X2 [Parasteatoda tepidariorum]